MDAYNPEVAPGADDWLELDEAERLELVSDYHRRHRIRLPNAELHATIHVVIENQLALGEKVVVDTLARLEAEGLDRHDAVHAIGSVLAEYLYELLHDGANATDEAYQQYLRRLNELTAETWHAQR